MVWATAPTLRARLDQHWACGGCSEQHAAKEVQPRALQHQANRFQVRIFHIHWRPPARPGFDVRCLALVGLRLQGYIAPSACTQH